MTVKTARKRGAQPGNKNNANARIVRDALTKYVSKYNRLQKLIEVLYSKASDGDMAAIKEIHDRLEGKAIQSVAGADGGDITVQVVRGVAETAR